MIAPLSRHINTRTASPLSYVLRNISADLKKKDTFECIYGEQADTITQTRKLTNEVKNRTEID
jgi:hypothetical protein